ncbi:hypothetical protein GTNG_2228 [Geobacillus thermodenitrificans NG80-2]|uniref:Uncharacterized protein n=1 Tax=Geobacillus thermodenitrificans (strain NG80-2) TaxID=420246 RepID=A4IQH3_GEOTN|nr:hypothetical protein GTNG_2228 [Geobacillus thermodenitrificans NG80-2]
MPIGISYQYMMFKTWNIWMKRHFGFLSVGQSWYDKDSLCVKKEGKRDGEKRLYFDGKWRKD